MASSRRRTDPSVEESLFDRGYEFEFFQAVRLLGRLFPDRKDVGSAAKPSEEVARFAARLSLAFPPSAIYEVEHTPDSPEPARMTVAFMGLTGTQGILPLHYTEYLLARKAAKDDTFAAFLDLFNHRLLSLFYRAWQKHHPTVLYESGALQSRQPDPFTQYLFDVIGMGTGGLRKRMGVGDESLLLYAGLLAQRPHSAIALRNILRDYFSAPIQIDQCLGTWYELEDQDRSYLSDESERNQLGEAAFIGDEVWDQQARFRIRVGPVGLERFQQFLPGGPAMAELVELTRYIAGHTSVFDVQVILKAEEVPECQLDDESAAAPRLGWMGWLKTGEFQSDAADAVFTWVS